MLLAVGLQLVAFALPGHALVCQLPRHRLPVCTAGPRFGLGSLPPSPRQPTWATDAATGAGVQLVNRYMGIAASPCGTAFAACLRVPEGRVRSKRFAAQLHVLPWPLPGMPPLV